ncbi:LptM family lipoprotein [Paenibacillus marinisediminis]
MKKILIFVLTISMVAILAGCGGKDNLTVFKSEDNKFQVSASDSWKDANGTLHPDSSLQIYNPQKEKYFMAILESKEDFTDFSLQSYYDIVTDSFISSLDTPDQGEVKEVTINGNKALQYTLEGNADNVNVAYLVTVIETPTHYGQLVAWTLKSKWDGYKDEYTNLINSFTEVK